MIEILIFLAGALCVAFVGPILEGLLSLILLKMETLKAIYNEAITESNVKVQKTASSLEDDCSPRAIGFTAPDEDYEIEEEDEDDL